MIQPEQFKSALYVVHMIFVEARSMAYQRVDHEIFAKFLDVAEIMPEQIALPSDETPRFRSLLEELVSIRPGIAHLLKRFDAGEPLDWGITPEERLRLRTIAQTKEQGTVDPTA